MLQVTISKFLSKNLMKKRLLRVRHKSIIYLIAYDVISFNFVKLKIKHYVSAYHMVDASTSIKLSKGMELKPIN